jgi:small subunit ribosomal protein S10
MKTSHVKILLKFKAYHPYVLKRIFERILKKSNILNLNVGVVSFPTHKKYYTVLRSPHIDKKARDQFEMRIHQQALSVSYKISNVIETQKLKNFLDFVKTNSIGAQLSIKYTFNKLI